MSLANEMFQKMGYKTIIEQPIWYIITYRKEIETDNMNYRHYREVYINRDCETAVAYQDRKLSCLTFREILACAQTIKEMKE